MSAEVIISKVPARTYTVPSALTASVGERAALDTVYDTLNSSHEAAREWAEKIIGGIERDRQKQEQAVLASIEYDPDKYFYWGLTASADDDLIIGVGRLRQPDTNIENSEILSQNQSWTPISSEISSDLRQKGVAMDPGLIAYTASAFAEGCRGVKLAYGDPLYFFETQPLLSSALIAATTPADTRGAVYAIVDATDTTAVMSVILIRPGPQVYRRDGGAWVLDNNTLDSLMSVNPPPIVELTGDTLTSVLEQVDAGQANQVAPTDDGQGETGQNLVPPDDGSGQAGGQAQQGIQQQPEQAASQTDVGDFSGSNSSSGSGSGSALNPSGGVGTTLPTPAPSDSPSNDTYKSNQNKSQLKDGSTAQTASLLARYDELEESLTTIRQMSARVASAFEPSDAKASLMSDIATTRRQLELREAHINNIVLPALLADAQSVHDATPNQLKARHLRQYWVHGAGAVKIRWGTEGDWTRCVRQLSKYLGVRAKGYCAKRHKEVMGFWPGDKRNTGKTHGVGVPLTAASGKRVVRTQEGAKRFKVPIGSVIDGHGHVISTPKTHASSDAPNPSKSPAAFIGDKQRKLGKVDYKAVEGDHEHKIVKHTLADGHLHSVGTRVRSKTGDVGTIHTTYQTHSKVHWDNGRKNTVKNDRLNKHDDDDTSAGASSLEELAKTDSATAKMLGAPAPAPEQSSPAQKSELQKPFLRSKKLEDQVKVDDSIKIGNQKLKVVAVYPAMITAENDSGDITGFKRDELVSKRAVVEYSGADAEKMQKKVDEENDEWKKKISQQGSLLEKAKSDPQSEPEHVDALEANKDLRNKILQDKNVVDHIHGYRHNPRVNWALRKTKPGSYMEIPDLGDDPASDPEVKALDSIFEHNEAKLKKPTVLYRGVDGAFEDQFKPGDMFIDKGYTSTSVSKKVANDIVADHTLTLNNSVKHGGLDKSVLESPRSIEIHVPAGYPAAYISNLTKNGEVEDDKDAYASQRETLLPRNTRFRVLSVGKNKMTIEVVPYEKPKS